MSSSMSWLEIQKRIQQISTAISCVLNSILVFLIVKYSPKKIGTYKWLMIYISIFQIFYSIMDVISHPVYHTVRSVFVVYKDVRHTQFALSTNLHYYLLVAYTGCYGFCMAIFAIHFYYRYLAISGKNALIVFNRYRMIFWFLVPPTFAAIWGLTAGNMFRPTPETDAEIGNSILEAYDIQMDSIVYIAAFVWPVNQKTGRKHLNLTATLGIAVEQLIIVSSLFAIFYFGIRCYSKIKLHVKNIPSLSRLTKNLQRQLFYALVLQASIPILLLHIPVSGLFIFPLLDRELGFFAGFVTITIALYPAIDPLPTIFVVENYRNAVFAFIRFLFYRSRNSSPQDVASNNAIYRRSLSFLDRSLC